MDDKGKKIKDEIEKEINYIIENKANIFKKVEKSFSIIADVFEDSYLKTFSILNEQMLNLKATMETVADSVKKNQPKYVNAVVKLKENGWAFPMYMDLDYSMYEELSLMDDAELNKVLVTDLTINDYENLYTLLDFMRGNLDDGYAKEVSKVIRILELDINNFTLTIPFLYTLLDFMITFQMEDGDLRTESYMRNGLVKNYSTKYSKEKDLSGYFDIMYIATMELILEHIKYISFSETPIFNRNFVLHGRLDPSNYTLEDFCKLVVLCSTLSGFQKMKP